MAGPRSALLLALPFLLVALLLRRAPFMMSEAPPRLERAWADGPIKLVTTPQYETKKTDIFTAGSTHMALLHNTLLRGFNSIYHQAPAVLDVDKADFIGYALTWHKFFMSHHDDEEAVLFKKIEELLADKDVFADAYEEHRLIEDGVTEFQKYLAGVSARPAAFSGAELVRIMDSFREPFEHHMHHEIAVIAQLAGHPKAPAPDSPQHAEAAAMFKAWGKATVTKAGTLDVVPFFLLHLDRTAEGGMWANWPPMPAPVRWMLTNVAGAWHGAWWRFSACDAHGKPQALWALRGGRP